MANYQITIKTHVAWWLPLYLYGLAFTCALMGTKPDLAKVTATVLKAVTFKVG